MQLKIEAVTKEPREYQGEKSWGVKDDHGNWYSFHREQAPKRGEIYDVEIKEKTGKDGRVYKDAWPQQPQQAEQRPPPAEKDVEKPFLPPNQNDVANAALYYLDALKLNLEQLTEPQASLICTLVIATFGKDNRASWDRAKSIDYLDGFDDPGAFGDAPPPGDNDAPHF